MGEWKKYTPELSVFHLSLRTHPLPLPPSNSQVGSASGEYPLAEIRGHLCRRLSPCGEALGWLPPRTKGTFRKLPPPVTLSCSGISSLSCLFSPRGNNNSHCCKSACYTTL